MKSELIQKLTEALAIAQTLLDDVLHVPATPTGLSVVRTYGWPENPNDATQHIELTWDEVEQGCQSVLEVIGAAGNPHGPMDWVAVSNSGIPDANGVRATHHLANAETQAIIFRLRAWRLNDNQFSEAVELAHPTI
jgi:hypothetical protein